MKTRGFTLIELLIVIIIIGILATLAIPQYTKMVEKSKTGEAKFVLGTMRTGEELYYAQKSKYTNSITDLETYVTVPADASTSHYFKYTIPSANSTSFAVRATRKISTDTGKDSGWGTAYTITLYKNGSLLENGRGGRRRTFQRFH